MWNVWEWNCADFAINATLASATGTSVVSGLVAGDGSSGTANTAAGFTKNTDGSIDITTGSTTGSHEVNAIGPNIFHPAADRPIYFFMQGETNVAANTRAFFGLCVSTDPGAAGPLGASGGTAANVDMVGFHRVQTDAGFTLRVQDATTDDTVSVGNTIADGVAFSLGFKCGINEVQWFAQDGSGTYSGTLVLSTNGPITDLGALAPTFTIQQSSTSAIVLPLYRAWVAQEKQYASVGESYVSDFGRS